MGFFVNRKCVVLMPKYVSQREKASGYTANIISPAWLQGAKNRTKKT
jgi:hypothetical protein